MLVIEEKGAFALDDDAARFAVFMAPIPFKRSPATSTLFNHDGTSSVELFLVAA